MAHGFLFYASRTTPAQPEEQNLFRRAEPGGPGDAAGAAAGHPYLRGAAKGGEVQGVDSRYPQPRHLHFKPRGCAFLGFSIFMAAIFQHDEPCHDTNNFCFNPAAGNSRRYLESNGEGEILSGIRIKTSLSLI